MATPSTAAGEGQRQPRQTGPIPSDEHLTSLSRLVVGGMCYAVNMSTSEPGPRLRHYFASLLIASGLDVKVVQARLRHASAKTTLDTYGHLWPDKDESSRAAVYAVRAHAESGRAASGSA